MTFPITSHYLPPQNSGPCNSFNCLGHFKNVYDDDDDDDCSNVVLVKPTTMTPTTLTSEVNNTM